MPKLSIITINWNNAEGLKKTIESVANQTYNDFEYIVIDGNSSDGSVDIIQQFESKINYWISEKDKGIYNAMNKGILKATGEYCLFLNSGDWLDGNEALSKAFSYNFESDIACFNLKVILNSGEIEVHEYPDSITFNHFLNGSIGHPSTFIKKILFDKFGLYNEENKIVSDWEFFMRVICLHQASYNHFNFALSQFINDGISNNKDFELIHMEERNKILELYFSPFLEDYKELKNYKSFTASQFIKMKLKQIFK